jgi:hypothetical protein
MIRWKKFESFFLFNLEMVAKLEPKKRGKRRVKS